MLADSLDWVAGKLEAALDSGLDQASAVLSVLKDLMDEHSNVIFGGDGYSDEWHKIAVEERGLKNIPTTADALPAFQDPEIIALFEKTGVLSPVELASRYEVYSEQYILSIEVEAKLVIDMATTSIYPAAATYLSELTSAIASASSVGVSLDNSLAQKVATTADAMMADVTALSAAIAQHDFPTVEDHMKFCANEIRTLMDSVRTHADILETMVADNVWPLPKYSEMLFIK
jgi:glutamine synthetase